MLWSHIARRYIFSPKSHSTINIIASVSVIAVAIPTAAMVILLSMFNGLSSTIERLYSAVDADIEIVAGKGQTFESDSIDLDAIAAVDGVVSATSYLEQSVLLSANGRRTTVLLRGIDDSYTNVFDIDKLVQYGDMSAIGRGEIILGSIAASELAAYTMQSDIEMFALNRKQVSTVLPSSGISHRSTMLGGVVMANAEIDAELALISLERAQQLLNYNGRITTIALRILSDSDAESIRDSVQSVVGNGFRVITRAEKHGSMNNIINMEKFVLLLIGVLIALIATFAIIGAVVMLITDKRRDIGTLRSMGASRVLIRRIFIGEGMMLATLGCIIGIVIGVGFCLLQQSIGLIRMPEEMIIEYYPVEILITDLLIITGVIVGVGYIVTRIGVKATLNRDKLQ